MKSKKRFNSSAEDGQCPRWKAIIYRDDNNITIYRLKSNERLLNRIERTKKRKFICINEKSQVVLCSNNDEKQKQLFLINDFQV